MPAISHTESELGARLLAQHVLGWTTERFLTDAQSAEPDGFGARYDSLVARRATREPLAYIVGAREFWGPRFRGLAGRADSTPVHRAHRRSGARSLSGSRCRAEDGRRLHRVRMRGRRDRARVAARVSRRDRHLDRSARCRAEERPAPRRLGARRLPRGRICWTCVDGPFDAIVANPPYVVDCAAAALQPEVRDHEAGSRALRRRGRPVARHAPRRRRAGAPAERRLCSFFEFGFGQDVEIEGFARGVARPRARRCTPRSRRHRSDAVARKK